MFSAVAEEVGEFLDYVETTTDRLDSEKLFTALSAFENLFSRNCGESLSQFLFPTLEGGTYENIGLQGAYPPIRTGCKSTATEGEGRVPGALINTLYAEAGIYSTMQPASVTRLANSISRQPVPEHFPEREYDSGQEVGESGQVASISASNDEEGHLSSLVTTTWDRSSIPHTSALSRIPPHKGLATAKLSQSRISTLENTTGDKHLSTGSATSPGMKLRRGTRAARPTPLPRPLGFQGRNPLSGRHNNPSLAVETRDTLDSASVASSSRSPTPRQSWPHDGPIWTERSVSSSELAAITRISAAWRGYAARSTFRSWRRAARVIQGVALRKLTLENFARVKEEWAREILGGAMQVQAEFRAALGRVSVARRRSSASYDSFMFRHTKATVPLRTAFLPFTLEPPERLWFRDDSSTAFGPGGDAFLPIVLQSAPAAFSAGRSEMLHAASVPELAFSSSTLRTLNFLCDPSVVHLIIVCQHKPKLNYYLGSLAKALGVSSDAVAERLTVLVPDAFDQLGVSTDFLDTSSQHSTQSATYTGPIQTILLSSPKTLTKISDICQEQRYLHKALIPYFLPTSGCYSSSENTSLSELVWRTGIPILGPLGPELGAYFAQITLHTMPRPDHDLGENHRDLVEQKDKSRYNQFPDLPTSVPTTALTDALSPDEPLHRYSLLDADSEFFDQQSRHDRILIASPKLTQPLVISDDMDENDRANKPTWCYHDFSSVPTFGSVSFPSISGMDSYLIRIQRHEGDRTRTSVRSVESKESGATESLQGERSAMSRSYQMTSTPTDTFWDTDTSAFTFRTTEFARSSSASWGSSGPTLTQLIPLLPISEFSRPSRRISSEIVKAFESRNYEILSLASGVTRAELVSVVVSIVSGVEQPATQRGDLSFPESRSGPEMEGKPRTVRRSSKLASQQFSEEQTSVTVLGTFRHISERLLNTPFPGRTLGYICPAGDPSVLKQEISPLLVQLVGCGITGLVTFSFLSITWKGNTRYYLVETAFGTTPPYEHLMVALSHCGLSWNSVTGELVRFSRVASMTRDGRPSKKEDLYSTAHSVSPAAIASLGCSGWERKPHFLVSLPFLWHESLRTTPSRDLLLILMENAFGFDYDAREGFLFDWNSGSPSFGCMGVRDDLSSLLQETLKLCTVLLRRLDAGKAIVPDSLALESAWNGEGYALRRRECLRTNLVALRSALRDLCRDGATG